MIPVIEDYLSELVKEKLAYIKNNPERLSRVLKMPEARLSRLKDLIANQPIRVIKGFPRDRAELPCIAIIMSGEDEEQEGLGDTGEYSPGEVKTHTETLVASINHKEDHVIPSISPTKKPVQGIMELVDQYGNVILEDGYAFNPDTGDVLFHGFVESGDGVTVTYTYTDSSFDNDNFLYESNYRLEVWTANSELTVELYHVLKWIMLSGRRKLIADLDIFRQKLGGGDLSPVPNYFPIFVYRRGLTFWCQFTAEVMAEEHYHMQELHIEQSISSFHKGTIERGDFGD